MGGSCVCVSVCLCLLRGGRNGHGSVLVGMSLWGREEKMAAQGRRDKGQPADECLRGPPGLRALWGGLGGVGVGGAVDPDTQVRGRVVAGGSETRAGAPRERECDSLSAGFKDGPRGLGLATGEGPEDPTPTPRGLERPAPSWP